MELLNDAIYNSLVRFVQHLLNLLLVFVWDGSCSPPTARRDRYDPSAVAYNPPAAGPCPAERPL